MRNSIAASRKLAVALVVWQAVAALVMAAIVSLVWGVGMAAAALFGGAVVVVPNAQFALSVMVRGAAVMPRNMPGVFYRAEVTKLLLMALGFLLGTLWFGDRFAALISTSAVCLAVNWVMLAAYRKT